MEIEEAEDRVVQSENSEHMTPDMRRMFSNFDNRSRPITVGRNFLANWEENLVAAERLISKWDTETTSDMLFYSSPEEVGMYMDTVDNLQRLMEKISARGSSSGNLIRAQRLMKMSMARLEKEFYKILLSNSDAINPEQQSFHSSTEYSITGSAPFSDDGSTHFPSSRLSTDRIWEFDEVPLDTVVDLSNIAQRMAKSGYARECVRVFVLTRKSVVEESLYNLGVEKVRYNDVRKMDWQLLDEKIKKWIYAVKISIRILFAREKRLCDEVFEGLDQMKDSCFAEITKEPTARLLGFPEAVAAGCRAPERIFRVLDLYDTLTDLMPDMEAIYCQELCRSLHEQADRVLIRLGEATWGIFTEFDKAIEKDNSKAPIAGGTLHPLTRYVMNYLTFLSDYRETLINLTTHTRVELPKAMPDDFAMEDHLDGPSAPVFIRLEWTVFLLLCKLDTKSDLYKDVALSYLFLMNNLHYIVQKVKDSRLKFVMGEQWLRKQLNQVNQYATNFEKAAWSKVLSSLTGEGIHETSSFSGSGVVWQHEALLDRLKGFNKAMEEVMRRHGGWLMPDATLRQKMGLSIAEKLIPAYTSFLSRFRSQFETDIYVKYTSEELQHFLSDMFKGSSSSGSSRTSR